MMLATVAFTMRPVVASSPSYVTSNLHETLSDTIKKDTVGNDTIKISVDSIAKASKDTTEKKEPLEAPVFYESTDSMVWVMGGNANL